jgi:ABC-2 type transport system ATP-binding protein
MDRVYELPYTRVPHPVYGNENIPAYEMIRFSVTIQRGCFGGCSFCSITEHEGRIIQNRSEDSILREVETIRDSVPGFTGVISDLGGPTANMYRIACRSRDIEAACRKPSCVYPGVCPNLQTDHSALIALYRKARALIGLVPQELMLEPFETVFSTVCLSRGLFGCKPDVSYIEAVLRQLSLLDKKDAQIRQLSGGMKRRVLIAKALSHDPRVLFLDEPTAGVDVELRRDMWNVIRDLKRQGVTIVLTTHYIEEAEEIADRVAVINGGKILLVEEKNELMKRLGTKQLCIDLHEPLGVLPDSLRAINVQRSDNGMSLFYHYDVKAEKTGISLLLSTLVSEGIELQDLRTYQSSLEDIFLDLVTVENK